MTLFVTLFLTLLMTQLNLYGTLYRYIENQQILEGSEATKTALRSVIRILKAELKKRGIPVPYAASGSGHGAEMMFGDIEVDDR